VRHELARKGWSGDNVVVGTATDPYQQAESSYRITRGILEAFRDYRNPVSITTKSPMILRDMDVLDSIVQSAGVTVCITITTLDESLWRKIEPTTSKPTKRLEAVARLRDRGVNVGVLLCPILPGLTDDVEHLEAVVAAAAEHGARFLASQVLRLGTGISDSYLPFIEGEFPKLMGPYRELYRGDYAPNVYVESMRKRVEDLKQRYGLDGDRMREEHRKRAPSGPRQLDLFAEVA
jgi:DNA repair photolyase